MAKELDNIKMWESIRHRLLFQGQIAFVELIDNALKDQCFKWDGEHIVSVEDTVGQIEVIDVEKNELKEIKQKPAWSVEDEIGLANTMWAVKQARIIAKDENDMGNLWYAENWLKSLKDRYTWKPSDEQIKILNEVLNFSANHESSHWNDYIFGTLNNLIRQLKKLREEQV